MLFHLTPLDAWLEHPDRPYSTPSLALEGFIHCSADEEQALVAANARFRSTRVPLMVLLIDEAVLDAPVRWEEAKDGGTYPHVYGPVNRAAVVGMLEARRDTEGRWASLAVWS
ncbi:DUF952 domain-containing protein [Streptacidiphilus pinicola]|uniref:DUF952 domain-containing protein n=1 Tax=Streptacidiphilus pinicola TaxID=2219663 RepID=A0A2X0IZ94_9ACTN|nr:DUF952 domain-containing protein [Streptacidiphilus pinicola]RAG83226.1 DUF952 domain-containing protein [Streptacidiphilus pinicola]